MQKKLQVKVVSKILDNNIDGKVKRNPKSLFDIVKSLDSDLSSLDPVVKEKLLKNIELDSMKRAGLNESHYATYSANQIYNIKKGYEYNLDVSEYSDKTNPASLMLFKRMILKFNKENPNNKFDMKYFDSFNVNKISLLFRVHRYNIENPDNKMDLKIIENEFNLKEAEKKFTEHINSKPVVEVKQPEPVVVKKEEKKPEEKVKEVKITNKDIQDMSFGELADVWNQKHPNSKINATLIYAQKNKKIAEMIYDASIYNILFKDSQIDLNIFLKPGFDSFQKDEILNGIKYNLKNRERTIPIEKYINKDIPAENMKIINKIMRLQVEGSVDCNIDFVINNYSDRQSLQKYFNELVSKQKS